MNCKSLTTSKQPCRRVVRAGQEYCHMHIKTVGAAPAVSEQMGKAEKMVDKPATREEGRLLLSKIMRGEFKETKTTSTGKVYKADTPLKYRIEATQLLARIDGWVDGDDDGDKGKPKVGIYKPGAA